MPSTPYRCADLASAHSPDGRGRNHLPGGLEPRCGDCEHFDEDGCAQAAEALALEGWPRAAVVVDPWTEAGRCPEYAPGAELELALDEEEDARRSQARVEAMRSYAIW